MVPAVERLTSEIHTYATYMMSCERMKISNIFVMGAFLLCQYQKDYNFLEELLLLKLRRINFVDVNDFTVRNVMNNTQVTKVVAPKYETITGIYDNNTISDNNDEQDRESLARIALSGSISYGISPNNRFYRRIACNSYFATIFICLQDFSKYNGGAYLQGIVDIDEIAVYATGRFYESHRSHKKSEVSIMEMRYPLDFMWTNGEDIDLSYTISNCQKDIRVSIGKYPLIVDPIYTTIN